MTTPPPKTSAKPRQRRGGTRPLQSRGRFDPISALKLSPAEVQFGAAMSGQGMEPAQILAVLLRLGYSHSTLNEFGAALQQLKKRKRGFPTRSEILHIALGAGWAKPAGP